MDKISVESSINVPELIEAWRNGDQQAADEIFNRYQSRLLMLVSGKLNERLKKRLDPEDLVMSIMRSAFRVTAQKDVGFQDESGFWKWLTTVALNKTYNRIDKETTDKRDYGKEVGSDSMLGDHLLAEPTPDDVAEVAELLEKISAKLNDVQAKILLAKLDGLSHAEIADELGVSTKTIQRNSHAIREAAIEVLGADVPEWLLPTEPSLAEQFVQCLNEPLTNWLPYDVIKSNSNSKMLSLASALQSNQPDLALLNGIRSTAKLRGNRSDSETPQLFCAAIYLLAIAAARVRLGKNLSADSDEKLNARIGNLMNCDWISPKERELLSELSSSASD